MKWDRMKKDFILITSSNFPTGGPGATYLNLFCKGVVQSGFTVRVLLLKGFAFGNFPNNDKRKNVTSYGVSYTYLGFTRRPGNNILKLLDDALSIFHLTGILCSKITKRKSIYLLVYNYELLSNMPVYLFALIFRFKVISFVPEYFDRNLFNKTLIQKLQWYGFISNFVLMNKISLKLIVFSYFIKGECVRRGFKDQDIFIQPNLTDFDYWTIDDSEIKYTIGYCGTPSVKDGLYDLFKAVKILHEDALEISLLVVGDATFGESLIPGLELECKKLEISGSVTFTGLVDQLKVRKYLSECKILAITRPLTIQTKAGFPTKIGEYFATGKPVLATDFGDIEKYFTDGIDIIIAESGNPVSIAHKIKWLIENDVYLKKITQSSYVKARELLEYKESVKRIICFIN